MTLCLAILACILSQSATVVEMDNYLHLALPKTGCIHMVYGAPDLVGKYEYWVDMDRGQILVISGANVAMRDAGGTYLHGSAYADLTTGLPGQWKSQSNNAAELLATPNPVVQAALILLERKRITVLDDDSEGINIRWQSPVLKVWKYNTNAGRQVEVDASQSVFFHISPEGSVDSWRSIQDGPVHVEGVLNLHDYTDAMRLGSMLIPRYIDSQGLQRHKPGQGVAQLEHAEVLEHAPIGSFTREGALQVAARVARVMVDAEHDNSRWPGRTNTRDDGTQPETRAAPTRATQGPSWSTAFILAGTVVFALGGFAWWRSRR